jgi:hypothetical protein
MTKRTHLIRIIDNVAALRITAATLPEAIQQLFDERTDWFELIKTIRLVYGVDIIEAERMVLAHEGWRRWCDSRINTDPRCRKLAWKHMRYNGSSSLIERDGDRLKVR